MYLYRNKLRVSVVKACFAVKAGCQHVYGPWRVCTVGMCLFKSIHVTFMQKQKT